MAGGEKDAPRRVVLSSSSSSSSQGNIGAVIGCDRVSCGVVRHAVGFKTVFDRATGSAHPVGIVYFFDLMC